MSGQLSADFGTQPVIALDCDGILAASLGGKCFKAVLEPTKGNKVQHLARACAKDSTVIVGSETSLAESTVEIML